jgi:hypothetical protein
MTHLIDIAAPSVDNADNPDSGLRLSEHRPGWKRGRWHTATVRSSVVEIAHRLLQHTDLTGPYDYTLIDCERLVPGGELVHPLDDTRMYLWHTAMASAFQAIRPIIGHQDRLLFFRTLARDRVRFPCPDVRVDPDQHFFLSESSVTDRLYVRPHHIESPDVLRLPSRIHPQTEVILTSATLGGPGSMRPPLSETHTLALAGHVGGLARSLDNPASIALFEPPVDGLEVPVWQDTVFTIMQALERATHSEEPTR